MLKKFSDHGEALKFGREFATANGCFVSARSVYTAPGESVTIIFGPSSAHHAGNDGGPSCSPWGGWHFGGGAGVMADSDEGRRLLALAEADALPGALENKIQLVNSHTSNYTPAERRQLAEAIVANGTCVWHECNAMHNRTHGTAVPCLCGRCRPRPVPTRAAKLRPAGRR